MKHLMKFAQYVYTRFQPTIYRDFSLFNKCIYYMLRMRDATVCRTP